MIIVNRFSALRQEFELTQQELADKLAVSPQAISNYELEKNLPDLGILEQMADLYGVSIDYLLNRADNRLPTDKIQLKNSLNESEDTVIELFRVFYNRLSEDLQHDIDKFLLKLKFFLHK